jgi:hypothetical protein
MPYLQLSSGSSVLYNPFHLNNKVKLLALVWRLFFVRYFFASFCFSERKFVGAKWLLLSVACELREQS